jgi:hypothetical protein
MALNTAHSYPSQYSSGTITTTSTVSSNSTGTLNSTQANDWGFNAALVKIVIDGGGPAYLQLNGQSATTNDYKLSSGDTLTDWYDIGVGLAGISVAATSTGISMRIGAWG